MPRKLLHVTMMVDASIIHELLTLIAGKAIGAPEIKPVSHGGEAENGGLKDAPSARDIILAVAQARDTFKPKDVKRKMDEAGRSGTNVYSQLANAMSEGLIKRIDDGVYALATKTPAHKPVEGLREGGQPARVLAAVREKQNGSGEGVKVADIRKAIGAKGNISPSITDLVRKKLLVKVGAAAYRAAV